MTTFVVQTMLMVVLAYLLGCALACLARRLLGPPRDDGRYVARTPAGLVYRGPGMAVVPVTQRAAGPLPAAASRQPPARAPATPSGSALRRADRLASTEPDDTRTQATIDRFRRALAEPPRVPLPAAEPAGTPRPPRLPPVSLATAARHGRPRRPVVPVSEATVQRFHRALSGPPATAWRPAPAPGEAPAPIGAETVAAAGPAAAGAGGAVADDLRRIRGIDGGLAEALHGLGVRHYAQIAAWTAADVEGIGRALAVAGRIQQENWIEQAQILAGGGETHFSRSLALAGEPGGKAAAAGEVA